MQAPTATIQLIQSILAPTLMISGCGLIQLSLINRYHVLHNRVRLLNAERRKLYLATAKETAGSQSEFHQLKNLERQITNLMHRTKMVHDAILYVIVGIIFFILSSLAIAVVLFAPLKIYTLLPLIIFLMGMASLFLGVIIFAFEIRKSFDNIMIEVDSVGKGG